MKPDLRPVIYNFRAGEMSVNLKHGGNTLNIVESAEELTFTTRDGTIFPCLPGFSYNLPPEKAFETLTLTRTGTGSTPLRVRLIVGATTQNAAALPMVSDNRAVADITATVAAPSVAAPAPTPMAHCACTHRPHRRPGWGWRIQTQIRGDARCVAALLLVRRRWF